MTTRLIKIMTAAAMAAAVIFSVSCSDDPIVTEGNQNEEEVPGQGQEEGAEVLGTYSFNGESYDILTAAFSETGNYYTFLFSPLESDQSITTYFILSIRTYWGDGQSHAVGGLDLDHNDDYIIIYEDPVRLYSQYREPQDGYFQVSVPDDRSGSFSVRLDVRLADGTPLSVDYSGPLTTQEFS